MEPANTVIAKLGGPTVIANLLGIHRTRVSKWKSPKEKGGTGGLIPSWHVARLLEFARQQRADLEPADFFPKSQEAAQ